MKRVLSAILVLCLVFSLIPVSFAADGMTELERAVVQTALAYYYKGNSVQYDSYYLAHGYRYDSVILRQTSYRSPEDSSPDDIHYTVCSGYPWDVYYNAFGIRLIDEEGQKATAPYVTDNFAPYYDGMGFSEEELSYEYAMQAVTNRYITLGRAYEGENAMSVGYWGPTQYDADGNVLDVDTDTVTCDEVLTLLRPGDIIAARPLSTTIIDDDTTTDDEAVGDGTTGSTVGLIPNGGHAMLYLGDIFGDGVPYVIHSWGAKYNDNNSDAVFMDDSGNQLQGYDQQESAYSWKGSGSGKYIGRNSSIVLTPYDAILGEKATYGIVNSYDFAILRPIANMTEANLTESAKFRLDRPGLAVTKAADVKPYRDVMAGDTITYTVSIENNTEDGPNSDVIGENYGAVMVEDRGRAYTDLKLTETIPTGATFVSATGGTESGGVVTWDISSLEPGETAELSYTVKVTGWTQIVSPKGSITAAGADGSLQTKELTHEVVSRQLDEAKAAAITASSVTASTAAARSGTDAAEDVYAAMGYALDLPDGQEFADMLLQEVPLLTEKTTRNQTDFQLVEESALSGKARTLRKMIVPGFVGGARLYTVDENGVRTNEDRLRDLREEFVQPGDVLVYLNTKHTNGKYSRATAMASTEAYVYLGGSDWAHYDDGVFKVTNDPIVTYYGNKNAKTKVMDSDVGAHTTAARSGNKKFAHSKILYQAFLQDVFFLLRPSRVGLTETAATSVARAVEVQGTSGSTYYADLGAAINAAADGDTIVLHEDLQLSKTQFIQKELTIDMNGHSITSTAAEPQDTLFFDSKCTLKNGTVDGVIYSSNAAVLRLEEMSLLGPDWEYLSNLSTITRDGGALVYGGNSSVTLKDVSIASRSPDDVPLQYRPEQESYRSVTVEDGVKIMIPSGTGWDYSSMNLGTGVKAYEGTVSRSLDGLTRGDVAGVAYTCFTFTASPDIYNETAGTYHQSLTEATNAASSGDTLRLLRDVDSADYDEVAQNYDSTTGAAKYFMAFHGDLTVEMDGHTIRDDRYPSGSFYLRDDGDDANGISTAAFRNGTILSASTAIAGGQVVLEDMTVRSSRVGLFLSTAGKVGQTALIKNSTIISGFGGGATGSAISVKRGTVTVQDSVLASNAYETILAGEGSNVGTVTLENTDVMAHMHTYNAFGTTQITNGSVTAAQGYSLTASRQKKTLTIDGKQMPFLADVYSLTEPVLTMNGKAYASLERALEEAQNGDTATMTADTAVTGTVTVPEGVSLELGSHTMTLGEDAAMTVAGTVAAGEDGGVLARAGQVKLEGNGSYLGITIPKGVEGTVYADPALSADFTITAGSTLEITGSSAAGYASMKAVSAGDGSVLAEDFAAEFSLGRHAAKDMNASYRVILTAEEEDGTYVGGVTEVCIRSCVEEALAGIDWNNGQSAALGRALLALLNYGAAAQTFFDYNTGALANRNVSQYSGYLTGTITESVLTENRVDESTLIGRTELLYGASCLLGEDLQMKLYFSVPEETEGLTFDVRYGTKSMTGLTVSDLTAAEGGYYSLTLSDLELKDFAQEVDITVSLNGKVVTRGKDSIRSYLARLHGLGGENAGLADAILTYALAVKELG